MQTHKTVSRKRNSSKDVLWKNLKTETKIWTSSNEYQDDQGKGTKITKSWKFSIYLGPFDLVGRNMCHSVTTTGNNCSPRIHYVIKSYFPKEIKDPLVSCFALTWYIQKLYVPGQGRCNSKIIFFIKHTKECAWLGAKSPFPTTSGTWV